MMPVSRMDASVGAPLLPPLPLVPLPPELLPLALLPPLLLVLVLPPPLLLVLVLPPPLLLVLVLPPPLLLVLVLLPPLLLALVLPPPPLLVLVLLPPLLLVLVLLPPLLLVLVAPSLRAFDPASPATYGSGVPPHMASVTRATGPIESTKRRNMAHPPRSFFRDANRRRRERKSSSLLTRSFPRARPFAARRYAPMLSSAARSRAR
jgi:corin